jgi:hypothetical protein
MPSIPTVNQFVPQEYQVLYVALNDNWLTEVQSLTVNRSDGGAEAVTLNRGWAGRVKGAEKTMVTLKGIIPYAPTDQAGEGFNSAGMLVGNGGSQMDATMLTALNQNGNQPIKFTVAIGSPAVQQLIFKGFVMSVDVDVAVGKQADWTINAEGQFSLFN